MEVFSPHPTIRLGVQNVCMVQTHTRTDIGGETREFIFLCFSFLSFSFKKQNQEVFEKISLNYGLKREHARRRSRYCSMYELSTLTTTA